MMDNGIKPIDLNEIIKFDSFSDLEKLFGRYYDSIKSIENNSEDLKKNYDEYNSKSFINNQKPNAGSEQECSLFKEPKYQYIKEFPLLIKSILEINNSDIKEKEESINATSLIINSINQQINKEMETIDNLSSNYHYFLELKEKLSNIDSTP